MSDHQVAVIPGRFGALANTLDSSMNELREASSSLGADVDAGMSTSAVSETLATFFQAIASMTADAEHQMSEVRESGGEYTRSDEQAEADFPPIAVPPNLEGDH